MKYKIRIVLERVIEDDAHLTQPEIKEIVSDIKPEIAIDLGVDESDIRSLTIKKVEEDA